MLIGFKVLNMTDSTEPLVRAFVESVCLLMRPVDVDELMRKWMYVTFYSTELTDALLAAQPFETVGVYSADENTVINNVEDKLELPYVDANQKIQIFKLGITESKNISTHIRYQLIPLEIKNIIRYTAPLGYPAGTGDFTREDYLPEDYLTD